MLMSFQTVQLHLQL